MTDQPPQPTPAHPALNTRRAQIDAAYEMLVRAWEPRDIIKAFTSSWGLSRADAKRRLGRAQQLLLARSGDPRNIAVQYVAMCMRAVRDAQSDTAKINALRLLGLATGLISNGQHVSIGFSPEQGLTIQDIVRAVEEQDRTPVVDDDVIDAIFKQITDKSEAGESGNGEAGDDGEDA